jgi:polyisoprenyl-phosphate glycosyltransferase
VRSSEPFLDADEGALMSYSSMYSVVIPVYKNADSLPSVLDLVEGLNRRLEGRLEAVFVVDGSPDDSHALLAGALDRATFSSQLLLLSRNFGSFAAIREGLRLASGPYFAIMAADLQEPADLVLQFFETLETEPVDLAMGVRIARSDPLGTRLGSGLFWSLYRLLVQSEMPSGGIDVFGCNTVVRDQLLGLEAVRTSLVGQLVWLGFRKKAIPYTRQPRRHGLSAWSFQKKLDYLLDSVFSFTDLPIKALLASGGLGLFVSGLLGCVVLFARITGAVDVPGYAATVLVILFFAALNLFGLGIVGSYAYRAFENSKGRPAAIVMTHKRFSGRIEP